MLFGLQNTEDWIVEHIFLLHECDEKLELMVKADIRIEIIFYGKNDFSSKNCTLFNLICQYLI